jgi:hypothetical protein
MKYLKILILFCLTVNEIHSQNTLIETKALQFFVDSLIVVLPTDFHKPFWFDGFIVQDTIDENLVDDVVNNGFVQWKRFSDKQMSDSELIKFSDDFRAYDTKLSYWETILPNKEKIRLKIINGLAKCRKLKWGHFSKKRLNLRLRQSFKFIDFNWVEIRLDKSDYEYGYLFYLKMNDEGKVVDWSGTYWIQ